MTTSTDTASTARRQVHLETLGTIAEQVGEFELAVAREVIAPDWVCETLADSTRELDLNGKRPVYAREGIPHLWLVEPTDRTLEAFELQEGQWVLIASVKDDDPVSIRPFDAITFSLGDLWP